MPGFGLAVGTGAGAARACWVAACAFARSPSSNRRPMALPAKAPPTPPTIPPMTAPAVPPNDRPIKLPATAPPVPPINAPLCSWFWHPPRSGTAIRAAAHMLRYLIIVEPFRAGADITNGPRSKQDNVHHIVVYERLAANGQSPLTILYVSSSFCERYAIWESG